MSRKDILFLTGCMMLLAGPAFAGDTGISIIYPPPRDVAVSDEAQPAKALKQTVTVTVITVTGAQPFAVGSWYRPRWDNRWTGYGLRGGDPSYSGPRYPF